MEQKCREVRVGVVKEYQEKKCVKWKTNSVRPSGCSSVVLSLFDGKARSVRCYVALLSVCLTVAWDMGHWTVTENGTGTTWVIEQMSYMNKHFNTHVAHNSTENLRKINDL